jgi:hypothetical protein
MQYKTLYFTIRLSGQNLGRESVVLPRHGSQPSDPITRRENEKYGLKKERYQAKTHIKERGWVGGPDRTSDRRRTTTTTVTTKPGHPPAIWRNDIVALPKDRSNNHFTIRLSGQNLGSPEKSESEREGRKILQTDSRREARLGCSRWAEVALYGIR